MVIAGRATTLGLPYPLTETNLRALHSETTTLPSCDSECGAEWMCDPMDGDENPITIDTAEHNHLQLLLCINELREHNGRSEALLSQVNQYIREQVNISTLIINIKYK